MTLCKVICAAATSLTLAGCASPAQEGGSAALESGNESHSLMSKPEPHTQGPRYWVTRPGHPVYNSAGEIVRSLRLQASVFIYARKDGRGLISLEKDEWVNLSDVSLEKPKGILNAPINETGMPRIQLPQPKD